MHFEIKIVRSLYRKFTICIKQKNTVLRNALDSPWHIYIYIWGDNNKNKVVCVYSKRIKCVLSLCFTFEDSRIMDNYTHALARTYTHFGDICFCFRFRFRNGQFSMQTQFEYRNTRTHTQTLMKGLHFLFSSFFLFLFFTACTGKRQETRCIIKLL